MMATPHREKLLAVRANPKLPESDRERLDRALNAYDEWIANLRRADGRPDEVLAARVGLLQGYKRFLDLEVIFASEENFLYRQKGQLKLDNSVIEEFLPWLLLEPILPLPEYLASGPTNCYSAIYFESSIRDQRPGAGIRVRTKDQDFALSRKLHVKASHNADYSDAAELDAYIAFVATEIKTNLDKTMFQEACATARDLRMAVPAARYFLMCEWLDMTPVSTAPTDIEEVLILRGGKRLASNKRSAFGSVEGRRANRADYVAYLDAFPFRVDVFARWVDHVKAMLDDQDPIEEDVLADGFF